MKKIYKFMIFAVVISLNLGVFSLCGYALDSEALPDENLVKYKGSVEELPEYIYDSYIDNEKAESIDIYDQNLYSVTTNNNDGSKTVELYQTPIKYIEGNEIKFIDTSLEQVSVLEQVVSKYFYKCETAPVKSFYPNKLTDGVSVQNGSYKIISYPNITDETGLKNLFKKPALSADNNLVYESVFSDFDTVTYSPVSNGIKEQIILSEYPGTNIFEFKIELTNLQPLCFNGDSIPLADKSTGEQVAAISQIDMRDSQTGEAFNTSLYNHLELEVIEGDLYLLRIVLDDEFLKSESTVYPVIIDPTVTFNADPIYDAPVFSGYPNTNFNGNTYNVVGYHGSTYGEAITFIKINNIQDYAYIRPENITSAYLHVYEGSGKTSSATVEVYNTKATWSNTSITYNNMPALNGSAYSSLTVRASGWYNFDIKGFIRVWLRNVTNEGGKSQNYGLALKMSETGVSSRHFCSATHSTYPPSIIINYNEDVSLNEGKYIIRSQYRPDTSKPYCYLYASGSNVVQYTAKGNSSQIWNVDYIGSGYYEIYSTYSTTKAIGVASSTPASGTNVVLYDSSAGSRIRCRIVKNADGSYRILSTCGNKNMGLSVAGPSNAANTNIETQKYSGATYHQWKFYKSAPCGYLSYWYSDSTQIGHHTSSNLKIYVDKTSGFGKLKSTLKSYVKYGLDAWSDLGYTYEFVDTADDCNIYVCGVSRAEAYALGFTNKDGVGVTSNIGETGTSSIYEGQSFSPGGWKSVYSLQKKSVYMIWDTTDDDGIKTSSFSSLKWKTAVAHEIGHALGYEGHCTSSYSLMMEDLNNCMATDAHSPAEMDFEHISQVY